MYAGGRRAQTVGQVFRHSSGPLPLPFQKHSCAASSVWTFRRGRSGRRGKYPTFIGIARTRPARFKNRADSRRHRKNSPGRPRFAVSHQNVPCLPLAHVTDSHLKRKHSSGRIPVLIRTVTIDDNNSGVAAKYLASSLGDITRSLCRSPDKSLSFGVDGAAPHSNDSLKIRRPACMSSTNFPPSKKNGEGGSGSLALTSFV
jgi:hypothetical protein